MEKFKVIQDILTPFGVLKKDSVIGNVSNDATKITFKYKTATIDLPKKEFESNFVKVDDNTQENINFQESDLLKGVQKGVSTFANSIKIGGGLGILGGVALANYRKSGVGGYIGWGLTLGIVGLLAGVYIGGKRAITKAI